MKSIVKLIFISAGILLTMQNGFAQIDPGALGYYKEALLFSRNNAVGTARTQALGGAQMALGGDIGNVYSNPAGLGFFNHSQFSITPELMSYNNESKYMNGILNNSGARLGIGNLGIVWAKTQGNDNGLKSSSFGISYTKVNNFNNEISYEGQNTDNSIIDTFIAAANGATISQFEDGGSMVNSLAYLGFNNYLIGPSNILPVDHPKYGADTEYFTDVDGIPNQSETIKTSGSQNQWSFSYGANFKDKFYIGANIGVQSITYESHKIYGEQFKDGPLFNLELKENLKIEGKGFNASLGMIYRPVSIVRFGFTITSPTYFNFTEESDASLNTNWDNFQYDDNTTLNEVSEETSIALSKYELKTPMKISTGAAIFINKNGFITGEVEFINYGKANLNSLDFSPNSDNKTIKNIYTSTVNFKLGGEYRFDIFRARLGYAYYDNPSTLDGLDKSIQTYSAGVGVKLPNFYADFALTNSKRGSENYAPYSIGSNQPTAVFDGNITKAVITIGFTY